jgi:hypothetical protein
MENFSQNSNPNSTFTNVPQTMVRHRIMDAPRSRGSEKNQLQEFFQKAYLPKPVYGTRHQIDAKSHSPVFSTTVILSCPEEVMYEFLTVFPTIRDSQMSAACWLMDNVVPKLIRRIQANEHVRGPDSSDLITALRSMTLQDLIGLLGAAASKGDGPVNTCSPFAAQMLLMQHRYNRARAFITAIAGPRSVQNSSDHPTISEFNAMIYLYRRTYVVWQRVRYYTHNPTTVWDDLDPLWVIADVGMLGSGNSKGDGPPSDERVDMPNFALDHEDDDFMASVNWQKFALDARLKSRSNARRQVAPTNNGRIHLVTDSQPTLLSPKDSLIYLHADEVPLVQSMFPVLKHMPPHKQTEHVSRVLQRQRDQKRNAERDGKVVMNKMRRVVEGVKWVTSTPTTEIDTGRLTEEPPKPVSPPSFLQNVGSAVRNVAAVNELKDEVKVFITDKFDALKDHFDEKSVSMMAQLKTTGDSVLGNGIDRFLSIFSEKFFNCTICFCGVAALVKIVYDCYHQFNLGEAAVGLAITLFLAWKFDVITTCAKYIASIRTFLTQTQDPDVVQNKGARDIFESLAGLAAVVLTAGVIKSAPSGKKMKSLVDSLSGFKRLREGSVDVLEYFGETVRKFYNKLAKHLGLKEAEEFSTGSATVDAWARDAGRWLRLQRDQKLRYDAQERDEVVRLHTLGHTLLSNAKLRCDKSSFTVIQYTLRLLDDLIHIYEEHGTPINGPRMVPVTARFYGEPGVGKTSMAFPLTSRILSHIYRDDPEKLIQLRDNLGSFVYPRNNEQKFWDGFFGQVAVIYDEFGQQKVPSLDNEEAEFIKIVSSFPFPIHVAAMWGKGNLHCHPQMVLLFTNTPQVTAQHINHVEAIKRRIDFNLMVVPKDQYCRKIDGKIPPRLQDRKLDLTTVPPEFTPEIYHFYPWDGQREQGEPMDFEQFVAAFKVKHTKNQYQATRFIQPVMKAHRDNINARLAELGVAQTDDLADRSYPGDSSSSDEEPGVLLRHFRKERQTRHKKKHSAKGKSPQTSDSEEVVLNKMMRPPSFYGNYAMEMETLRTKFGWPLSATRDEIQRHFDDHGFIDGCRCRKCVEGGPDGRPNSCECRFCSSKLPNLHEHVRMVECEKLVSDPVFRSGHTLTLWERFTAAVPLHVKSLCGDPISTAILSCSAAPLHVPQLDNATFRNFMGLLDQRYPDMPDSKKAFVARASVSFFNKLDEKQRDALTPEAYNRMDINQIVHMYNPISCYELVSVIDGYAAWAKNRATHFVRWIGAHLPTLDDLLKFFAVLVMAVAVFFYLTIAITIVRSWFGAGLDNKSGEIRRQSEKKPFQRPTAPNVVKNKQDQGATDQANSDYNGSWYGLFNTKDDPLPTAYVYFLEGFVGITVLHVWHNLAHEYPEFLDGAGDRTAECEPQYLYLKSPMCDQFIPVAVADMLRNCDTRTFADRDLFTFQLSQKTGMPPRPQTRGHFLDEKDFHRLNSISVLSLKPKWNKNHERETTISPAKLGHTARGQIHAYTTDLTNRMNLVARDLAADDGECGTPWYLVHRQTKGKIIGFLMGGTKTMSFASPFLKEDYDLALKSYVVQCKGLPVGPSTKLDNFPNTKFLPVREVPPPAVASRNNIVPSPLQKQMETVFPVKTGPAAMRPKRVDEMAYDPWACALGDYAREPLEDHRFNLVQKCAPDLLNHLERSSLIKVPARVFSQEEAIFGNDLESDWSSITRLTSAGYPFCLHTDGKPGKTKWMGADGIPSPDDPDYRFLTDSVNKCLDQLAERQIPDGPFLDFLKVERRPLEKVRTAQTRYISGASLPMLVVCRMYLGAFALWMHKNKILNGNTVGVNPHSAEWDFLKSQFKKMPKVADSDVRRMDASNRAQMIRIVLNHLINRWYESHDVKITDRDRAIRETLTEWLANSYHVLGSWMYQWFGCNSSGNFLTAYINGFAIMLGARAAFSMAHNCMGGWKDDDDLPTTLEEIDSLNERVMYYNDSELCEDHWPTYAREFEDNVRIVVHGDDNIIGTTGSYPLFTPRWIALYMSYLGYTMTGSNKAALGDTWKTIWECTFLKRGFEVHELTGRVVAPLSLDTILESPQWMTEQVGCEEIAKQTFDDSMSELAVHHPKVWGEWMPKLTKAYAAAYGETYSKTQRECLQRAHSLKYVI